MYKTIKKQVSALDKYSKKLVADGTFSGDEITGVKQAVLDTLEKEFKDSVNYVPKPRDWLASHWQGFKGPDQLSKIKQTGVKMETLKKIGDSITTIPAGFTPHRVVKRCGLFPPTTHRLCDCPYATDTFLYRQRVRRAEADDRIGGGG